MNNYYKDRDNTLRAYFDNVATEYDQYRLEYPNELFRDIFNYAGNINSALEIGIGTGKATAPFLKEGISVIAIEPNSKMAEIANKKNNSLGTLEIFNGKFEDFSLNDRFDLVYAASSFQWLSSDNRMEMIANCLRDNGVFAKFKTITIINPNDSIGGKILYQAYKEILPDYLPKDRSKKKKSDKEFIDAGFTNIIRKDYYRKYFFNINKYIAFMNTYTEYLTLDINVRKMFENYIAGMIKNREILVTQKCTLDLATLRK